MKTTQIRCGKKMTKTGLGLVLILVMLFQSDRVRAQNTDMNYNKSVWFLIPAQEENLNSVDTTNRIKAVTYFDEMGRPIQRIIDNASPNGKDLVSHMEYDEYGRITKSYLPYEANYSLLYQSGSQAVQDQYNFYQGGADVAHDQRPYSDYVYDGSPMNRVVQTTGPGQDWAAANKSNHAQYLINEPEDSVIDWRMEEDKLVKLGEFPSGELFKSVIISEDNQTIISFTNKSGKLVLKRVQAPVEDGGWADTYRIYDDFGNLRCVLPPLALEKLNTSDYGTPSSGPNGYYLVVSDANYEDIAVASEGKVAFTPQASVTINPGTELNAGVDIQSYEPTNQYLLTDQIYQYEYDHRHRLVAKRVPGAGWEYMVYDARDRLVLTQTANQREDTLWSFVKYDQFNRPVITGEKKITGDVPTIRNSVAGSSGVEYFDVNGLVQYTNVAYPAGITVENILSVSYYDNYAFTNETFQLPTEIFDSTGHKLIPTPSTFGVKGLTTGSMAKISGTTDQFVSAVNYYDEDYRVIQTITKNYKGGTDRITAQYQWVGLLMKTYVEHEGFDAQIGDITITQEYTYDQVGRHLTTTHQINDGAVKSILENSYNALGQIKNKTLADGYEEINYAFNIRGQIIKMNDPEDAEDHLFEMAFKYQDATHAKYNGNIGEVVWKNPFENTANGFDYQYDVMNRISSATGLGKAADNDLTNIKYDLNGNIQALDRTGTHELTSNQIIDQLTYTYNENTNRLTDVADASGKTSGFNDGNTSDDDYDYDANGNLIEDKNKGITKIDYNLMNQPTKVTYDTNKYMEYTYAGVAKVSQKLVDNGVEKVTDYIGSFIYENDSLQLIGHGEGRIVAERDISGTFQNFEYQYHLRDHLGNVRVTFKTDTDEDNYLATMEDQDTTAIKAYFDKYDEVSRIKSTLFDHTTDSTGYALWLDGSADRSIGLAKSLMVKPGDVVNMEVFAKYYHNDSSASWTGLLNTIAANIAGGAPDVVYEAANTASGLPFADFFSGNRNPEDAPKAYLNYLVFDNNFKIDSTRTGFQQISTAAEEKGNNGDHEKLSHQITFDQMGYVYIYLSNEEDTPMDVFFDDFKVTQTHSPVVQKDDYYPFGLSFNSYTRAASTAQNFKFNAGSELEEMTDWYSTPFRKYDPSLGRFHGVDALADMYTSITPSHFGMNNPVNFNDPTGLNAAPGDPENGGDGGSGDSGFDPDNCAVCMNELVVEDSRIYDPAYGSGLSMEILNLGNFGHDIVIQGNRSGGSNGGGSGGSGMSGISGYNTTPNAAPLPPATLVPIVLATSNPSSSIQLDNGNFDTVDWLKFDQANGGGVTSSETLGWIGVGLGVLEEGAANGGSFVQRNMPILNDAGKVIGNWRITSKVGKQALSYVKTGASVGGYVVAGGSIAFDAVDYSNGALSGQRFSYRTAVTGVGIGIGYIASGGWGALATGIGILGEHAYDSAVDLGNKIANEYYKAERAMKQGWRPF